MEVSIWLALLAGIVSFLSPCIFPLVPAYLAQLTGANISNNQIEAEKRLIISRSLGFILGFTMIFLLLGASATFLGQIFLKNTKLLEQLGGIIIVIFGLQMYGIFQIQMLLSEKRFHFSAKKATSFSRSVLFGFIFGAGWSPCIGLILGAILTLASQSGTMFQGMLLLLVYSFGLGIPFFLVALLWSRSLNKMKRFNKIIPKIQKVSGVILVLLGVLLFTGYYSTISAYLARFIPFNL